MSLASPTIESPVINIRFGGVAPMHNDCYKSFDFIADEDNILPKCVIRLTDMGSKIFKSFWGLEVGSKVEITITEGSATMARIAGNNPDSFSVNLVDLSVAAVYSNEVSVYEDNSVLEVLCVHPWNIFQDLSFHAYAGKSNSEIIKGLVQNTSTRGFGFKDIDSNIFLDTDEDGNIPRYKCGEGDLDFIINKVLPYTTINNTPPCFFIDDKNNVHLESFQSMFAKDPKLILVGGTAEDVTDEHREKAETYGGLALASNLIVKVGDANPEKLTRIIKREVSFDDPSSLTSFTGRLPTKIAVGKWKKGQVQDGHVPISLEKVLTSDATDKVYYRNHNFKDLKAISLNEQKPFNSFFKIEINTTFCGHQISIGDNVELSCPNTEDNLVPWVNGKWHVKSIKYKWNVRNNVPTMTLTLIRPSFLFNSNTTTIINPDDFYAIGLT